MKRILAILVLVVAGCGSNQLDTGYRPKALTDSAAQRRGYYTNPYSPGSDPDNPAAAPDPSQHRPRGF